MNRSTNCKVNLPAISEPLITWLVVGFTTGTSIFRRAITTKALRPPSNSKSSENKNNVYRIRKDIVITKAEGFGQGVIKATAGISKNNPIDKTEDVISIFVVRISSCCIVFKNFVINKI